MKQMLKLGLILALYTSIACIALALVNNFTAGAIQRKAQDELTRGLREVFTEAGSFEEVQSNFTASSGVHIDAVYTALKDGRIIGSVVKATGSTYDKATILVGIKTDNTITSIQFLSLTDTPGFGQKAAEPAFKDQFSGKSSSDEFALGADIDVISGATITTKGVTSIVKSAAESGLEAIKNGGAN